MRDCAGGFLPWQEPYDAIAALPAYGNALVIPVFANGVALRALLDTGAGRTILFAPGVARLGLAPPPSPALRTGGLGPRRRPVWTETLSSLRVGGETTRHVIVLGSKIPGFPIVDMALGADWFTQNRVWLSYATSRVFVAR